MSKTIAKTFLTGVHVSSTPTYIPGYIRGDGKVINPHTIVHVIGNMRDDKLLSYKLDFWGKIADSAALSCSKGKELTIEGVPESYVGTLFDKDGNPRLDATGKPIKTTKHSIKVTDFSYGNDAAKIIQDEINRGIRPADWNVPGSPGSHEWKEKLAARRALVYDGTSALFGYARVIKHEGNTTENPTITRYAKDNLPNEVATAVAAPSTTVY
jgi:hypothetical protein